MTPLTFISRGLKLGCYGTIKQNNQKMFHTFCVVSTLPRNVTMIFPNVLLGVTVCHVIQRHKMTLQQHQNESSLST